MDNKEQFLAALANGNGDPFAALDEVKRQNAGKAQIPNLPRVLPSQESAVERYRAAVAEFVAAEGKRRWWNQTAKSDAASVSETAAQGLANANERYHNAREALNAAREAARAAGVPAEIFHSINTSEGYAK